VRTPRFRFVDELTPEHFDVLKYAADPIDWFDRRGIERSNIHMGAPRSILSDAHLPVSGVALDVVLRDINDRGLASTGSLRTMMSENVVWRSFATDLGRELLNFVATI